LRHSSQAAPAISRPWVKWLGAYQSVMCWLFSELCTTPCHSLTVPQVQIGGRSIANSTATAATNTTSAAIHARLCGHSLLPCYHPTLRSPQ
jgi:hypothetical protein